MRRLTDHRYLKSPERSEWARRVHYGLIPDVADPEHPSPEEIAFLHDKGALRVGGYLISNPRRFRDWLNIYFASRHLSIGDGVASTVLTHGVLMSCLSASDVAKTACLTAVRSTFIETYGVDDEDGAWRRLRVRHPTDFGHLAVSYVAGRDRRRTTQVEEACLSRHILRYFTEREMSRERDEVLDQCREWLNRNLVEGDPALWTNERVRVWFQTNKHRFVPSTVGGTRSDCATQNMRMRLDIRRLGAELRRQYALIDRLESEGASREEVIRRLRHDLALADDEIEELIQENDRLQSELTATRGVLEEILDAEDNGDRALKDRLPDTDRSQLDWFLREAVRLADDQMNRRRYSERMLEVAFILHRQSPAAYETLRELIALPSRTCLQTHFRELMEQQIRKMTNPDEAEGAVREHCDRYHPGHMECVFAGDATGLSGSGMRQKAKGGYCFAFAVFFLDASVPDLWLHVAQRGTGSLKDVEHLEVRLIEACQRAGLIVVFIAHDGDRFGDKYHLRTFKSYAECDRCESLEAVVDYLEGLPQNAFVCFHIPDPLHLFKNDRQRLRNHPLALLPDDPSFDASTLSELLPPQVVSVPGQGGSMSDHLALQLCAPEVLAAALEMEDCPSTAPVFLAPISLIATALGCPTMTRAARMEALSVAYGISIQIYMVIEQHESEASESAAAGSPVTVYNRNHLRRLMNLCVGLFYALRKFHWEINLARLGTHVIEGHFGIVRSALRGQGQWNFWKGAEAFAALLRAIKEKLGLKPRGRASRIRIAGALAPWNTDEEEGLFDQSTQPGEERETFLAAVASSVHGEDDGLEALWEYTTKVVAHLSLHPIRTDSEPSPVRGRVCEARYVHPPPEL